MLFCDILLIMLNLFNREIIGKIVFLRYRYRFLGIYILIGIASLVVEVICYHGLQKAGLHGPVMILLCLVASILFAFWMNVHFNFKVPTAKRRRAFLYFIFISAGSAIVQFTFKKQLEELDWSYASARFAISGCFFLVGYMLHRKFSFADYKKVGVAIYANGIEDIKKIYERIGVTSDFLHVDIIDSTFGESSLAPKAYRAEVIRAYWPKKQIHIHIMSKEPSKWIDEIAPFANTIFVHAEIDEDVSEVISLIRSRGKKVGLCATVQTPVEELKRYAQSVDSIMLLAIPKLGKSAQKFDINTLNKIKDINTWEERPSFELCVDGGVNEKNIHILDVNSVVSGSSVLNHLLPVRQIMRLQTSCHYEKV